MSDIPPIPTGAYENEARRLRIRLDRLRRDCDNLGNLRLQFQRAVHEERQELTGPKKSSRRSSARKLQKRSSSVRKGSSKIKPTPKKRCGGWRKTSVSAEPSGLHLRGSPAQAALLRQSDFQLDKAYEQLRLSGEGKTWILDPE